MSVLRFGNAISLLRFIGFLLAITATVFTHATPAQVRDPVASQPDVLREYDGEITDYLAPPGFPLPCQQSAGQTAEGPNSQAEPSVPDRRDLIFYSGDTEHLKPL